MMQMRLRVLEGAAGRSVPAPRSPCAFVSSMSKQRVARLRAAQISPGPTDGSEEARPLGSNEGASSSSRIRQSLDPRLYTPGATADSAAQDPNDVKVLRWSPLEGFMAHGVNKPTGDVRASKRLLGGKLAVLGLGSVLIAERVTGEGALQAMGAASPTLEALHPAAAFLIAGLFVLGCTPSSQQDKLCAVERRQHLSGRAAFIGLAVVLLVELVTGQGFLELCEIETGLDVLPEVEAVGAFLTLLLLTGKAKHTEEDA